MKKKEVNDHSWVVRGKQRRNIIKFITKAKTPSQIAAKSGYSLNNTSRVLSEFKKKGFVKCLNPEQKTGRLYVLTQKGRIIRDKIKEE